MLGQTIGSYRITAFLGEGGMGRVYLAEHALIGRKAAVKVLLPGLSEQAEIVDRFFNEARALAQLQHPGLVDVFDYGKHTDGSAYLVMEFLSGESLASRLRREQMLSPGLAIEIARQIALAVGAAHKQRIVHRDLKPDNVILVPDPELLTGLRAKILDFGIAKLADGMAGAVRTRMDLVMGTPAYMSPEQCRGAGLVDERTDIYSLGCILFEMVCGRLPFTNEASGELIGAHIFQTPPRPSEVRSDVPAELETVIVRMMEKSPNARYRTMAQLAMALDRLQQVLPPPARSLSSQPTFEEAPSSGRDVSYDSPTTLRGSTAELTQQDTRSGRSARRTILAVGVAMITVGAGGVIAVSGGSRKTDNGSNGVITQPVIQPPPTGPANAGTSGQALPELVPRVILAPEPVPRVTPLPQSPPPLPQSPPSDLATVVLPRPKPQAHSAKQRRWKGGGGRPKQPPIEEGPPPRLPKSPPLVPDPEGLANPFK